MLEDLGGTYIKFGQVLALQPDVLPIEYCDALFDLMDRVPSFPYAEVEKTFLEDHGRKPAEMFDEFQPQPIAAASIGQVHVAYLGQRKLAVKVRRPTVVSDFATDILMMRAVASSIDGMRLRRWKWLARMLREFCAWTHEELDYRYEARFMASLGYNARNNASEAVPEMLSEYNTSRILVADFMDGPMVLDYIRSLEHSNEPLQQRLYENNFDHDEFARNIVRNFVSDAFQYGLFHADLHPANLMIMKDNVVGYVDFGITGSLSGYSKRNMVSLTLAITRADLNGMMVHFLRLVEIEKDSDVGAFELGLAELLDDWFDSDGDQQRLRRSFSLIMLDMLRLSRKTNVWPSHDVMRYLRSVITADGLIKRFAPNLDVSRYLESVCRDYLEKTVWSEWLSTENISEFAADGAMLMRNGPDNVAYLLQKELNGQTVADASQVPKSERSLDGQGRRTLALGTIALVSASLAWATEDNVEYGFNLFTAEIIVAIIASILLLRTIRGVL
jgi:ubiquinone biosynthesis protein